MKKTRGTINDQRQADIAKWRKRATKKPPLATVLGIVLPNSPDISAYVSINELNNPILVVDFGVSRTDDERFNTDLWISYHQDVGSGKHWWPPEAGRGTSTKDQRYLVYFIKPYDERNLGDLETLQAGVSRANMYAQQRRLEALDKELQQINEAADTEIKALEEEARFYARLIEKYGAAPSFEASPF